MTRTVFNYYLAGDGLDYHSDFTGEPEYDKYSITMNCYLNNEYEGGEIVFRIDGKTELVPYRLSAGDMLFFPSAPPYEHMVTDILSGTRYFSNRLVIEQSDPVWQEKVRARAN